MKRELTLSRCLEGSMLGALVRELLWDVTQAVFAGSLHENGVLEMGIESLLRLKDRKKIPGHPVPALR